MQPGVLWVQRGVHEVNLKDSAARGSLSAQGRGGISFGLLQEARFDA